MKIAILLWEQPSTSLTSITEINNDDKYIVSNIEGKCDSFTQNFKKYDLSDQHSITVKSKEGRNPTCTEERSNRLVFPHAPMSSCHWGMLKWKHEFLRCIHTLPASPIEYYVLYGIRKREDKQGKCRRKRSVYSKVPWKVNLPERLSVIREETNDTISRTIPCVTGCRRKGKENHLGKYGRKRSACSKISRQVNALVRLSAIKEKANLHLALP